MAVEVGVAAKPALVVGTDGTSVAAAAVRWALEDAHRRRVPLHVLTA